MHYRKKLLSIAMASAFGLAIAPAAYATDARSEPAANKQAMQTGDYHAVQASHIIGKDVKNAEGEVLGNIDDLVIDAKNGWVHYAVLSRGGLGGIGSKLFAYPMAAFQPGPNEELILQIDEAKLENAKGFDDGNWPNFSDATYRQHIDQNFSGAKAVAQDARLVRVSEFIDEDIETAQGEDIGELEDVVINLKKNQVHYAVAELDDWGLGDTLYALPLRAFSMDVDGDDLVLNVDKTRIDTARGFDDNKWPNLNDPAYVRDIDVYFVTLVPAASPAGAAGRTGSPSPDDKPMESRGTNTQ